MSLPQPISFPYGTGTFRPQPGITDPQWPRTEIPGATPEEHARFERLRGAIAPQKFLTVLGANVHGRGRSDLRGVLRRLTDFIREQMARTPSREHLVAHVMVPESYRLTITVGFGASLFTGRRGEDRFGIQAWQPDELHPLPRLGGEANGFDPAASATDLLIAIASDEPYVNNHVARRLASGEVDGNGRLQVCWRDEGYQRPDDRHQTGVPEGTDNLRNWPGNDLDRLVYLREPGRDSAWTQGGSYLVYRKLTENYRVWNRLGPEDRSKLIGREITSGCPLSRFHEPGDPMAPVYRHPSLPENGPESAHIRKANPRRVDAEGRPVSDFTGTNDWDRRFLRRAYPFADTDPRGGGSRQGLLMLMFMRSLVRQFEWVTRQWQMNPDFPSPGSGIDRLFGSGFVEAVSGGYYFCPPAPRGESDFLASGLLE